MMVSVSHTMVLGEDTMDEVDGVVNGVLDLDGGVR